MKTQITWPVCVLSFNLHFKKIMKCLLVKLLHWVGHHPRGFFVAISIHSVLLQATFCQWTCLPWTLLEWSHIVWTFPSFFEWAQCGSLWGFPWCVSRCSRACWRICRVARTEVDAWSLRVEGNSATTALVKDLRAINIGKHFMFGYCESMHHLVV